FRMTTPEEETDLFTKARAGCETSREFLIRNHLLFALMQAMKCVKGGRLPKDEIISAANFAVMKAFQSFDHTRGKRFTAYLKKFIRGEIADLWASKFLGTAPDPSICLGNEYGCQNHSTGESFDAERRMDFYGEGRGSSEIFATLPDVEENDLHNCVNEAISTFEPKDQELLREIYLHGKTPADIARDRGLSRQAVHATHKALLERLKKMLKK